MEIVKELLRKLEPVIGANECKKWWVSYVTAESIDRKLIEQHLQLKVAETVEVGYENNIVLLPPPPFDIAQEGKYHLGKIYYGNTPFYKFNLKEKEWLSHIIIAGRSGSGKTNTVFYLIGQLIANKKPFWVFDFKRNYRDLLSTVPSLSIYTVGRDISNITNFNPLVPIGDPHYHIRFIVSLICKAFFLGEGAYSLLIKCLDQFYTTLGIYNGNISQYPTLRNVQTWLEKYKPKSGVRDGQWRISTLRAIKVLNFGPMGNAFNSQKPFPLKKFLGKRVIFELDAISKHDKIFFLGLLLYYRHRYKLSNAKREKLQDVLIIEEAHHLLPRKGIGETESILEKFLREERELGTGIVIIDQMVSRLSEVAFANTATTIALNQKHRTDINSIANAVILDNDEKKYLSKLKVGHAIVRQQERWASPFIVKIPIVWIKKGVVSDEMVKKHMKSSNLRKISITNSKEETLLDKPFLEMLENIHDNPDMTVVGHYKKLGFCAGKGNKIKNELIEKALIKQANIKTRKGVSSFLQLTKKGGLILQLFTKKQVKIRAAGSEHEYYKRELAKIFTEKGFEVKIETRLEDGSRPDILVDNKIAVEIETGKSKVWLKHIVTHITNNRNIIVAATNKEAYDKIISSLTKSGLFPHDKIRVIIPNL